MRLVYLLLLGILFASSVNAKDDKVDCLILEDENSIICKYSHERISVDKNITMKWVSGVLFLQGCTARTRGNVELTFVLFSFYR